MNLFKVSNYKADTFLVGHIVEYKTIFSFKMNLCK